MRLISQNSIIDIPYEKACLYISETENHKFDIIARVDGVVYIMAEYHDIITAKFYLNCAGLCGEHDDYVFPDDNETFEFSYNQEKEEKNVSNDAD